MVLTEHPTLFKESPVSDLNALVRSLMLQRIGLINEIRQSMARLDGMETLLKKQLADLVPTPLLQWFESEGVIDALFSFGQYDSSYEMLEDESPEQARGHFVDLAAAWNGAAKIVTSFDGRRVRVKLSLIG